MLKRAIGTDSSLTSVHKRYPPNRDVAGVGFFRFILFWILQASSIGRFEDFPDIISSHTF